jgi:hypothetical protein
MAYAGRSLDGGGWIMRLVLERVFGVAGISDDKSWMCGTTTSALLEVDALGYSGSAFTAASSRVSRGGAVCAAGTDNKVDPVAGPTPLTVPEGPLIRVNGRFLGEGAGVANKR